MGNFEGMTSRFSRRAPFLGALKSGFPRMLSTSVPIDGPQKQSSVDQIFPMKPTAMRPVVKIL